MRVNTHLLKINRNFLICFALSMLMSAIAAQLLEGYDSYINTTVTVAIGYAVFFMVFSSLFYIDNRKRYKEMESKVIRKELFGVISSIGIGEVIFFIVRWFTHYYFLQTAIEPYLTSVISHGIAMVVFMVVVTMFLKKKKTF